MKEGWQSIPLGPAPMYEEPVQPGERDYRRRATAECNQYIEAIIAAYSPAPDGAVLRIIDCHTDEEFYMIVSCEYDPSNAVAKQWAEGLEDKLPTKWSDVGMVASKVKGNGREPGGFVWQR